LAFMKNRHEARCFSFSSHDRSAGRSSPVNPRPETHR
jgi:hypothetical protein